MYFCRRIPVRTYARSVMGQRVEVSVGASNRAADNAEVDLEE